MSDYKKSVDELLLMAQQQLSALEQLQSTAHPMARLSFIHAAITQQAHAVQAYLLEITQGDSAYHGNFAVLNATTPGVKQDFRLTEMRELAQKQSWLKELLALNHQLMDFGRPTHTAHNFIASSADSLEFQNDWHAAKPESLGEILCQLRALIQQHRNLALEY